MATFKKTLEAWYKETRPRRDLAEDLKNRNIAATIISRYLVDDDAVEYTTEYGRGLYIFTNEHVNDRLKIDIGIDTMLLEQLYAREIFTYSITAIDLAEFQRKLESTVISVCKHTDWCKKRQLEELRKRNEMCKADE